jgi:hypothetical protein
MKSKSAGYQENTLEVVSKARQKNNFAEPVTVSEN